MAQATMSHCSTDRQTARFCNDFHAQLFLTGSAACAGLPAWTAPAPALDPGGASRRRSLGVLRLRALRRLRALVPRGGYGDPPVHDLLLRRVDRAPRLRPLAPDRTHPAREGKKQDLLRDVLPPGASSLSESADLSSVQARRPARQRRTRTASPSGFLNPSQ